MKAKLIIAISAFVVLGVLVTGIVVAHNPYTPATAYPNERHPSDTGYYYGGCYGYDSEYTYPPATPEQPTTPGYYYPPQTPNQEYSFGRGCWGW